MYGKVMLEKGRWIFVFQAGTSLGDYQNAMNGDYQNAMNGDYLEK